MTQVTIHLCLEPLPPLLFFFDLRFRLWSVELNLKSRHATYIDANSANHGFVRTTKGKITTFDVPGAGTGNFQGTVPVSVNNQGTIAGYFTDANGVNHGFIVVAGDVCEP